MPRVGGCGCSGRGGWVWLCCGGHVWMSGCNVPVCARESGCDWGSWCVDGVVCAAVRWDCKDVRREGCQGGVIPPYPPHSHSPHLPMSVGKGVRVECVLWEWVPPYPPHSHPHSPPSHVSREGCQGGVRAMGMGPSLSSSLPPSLPTFPPSPLFSTGPPHHATLPS